jgi:hypothetical protein
MVKLRTLLFSFVLCMTCMAVNAQKPLSGTYKIGNEATGKWVQIEGRYYAKPEAELANASEIYVGVGINEDKLKYGDSDQKGHYRIYSLRGNYDGSTIDVFNYVDKAVAIVEKLFLEKSTAYINNSSDATLSSLTDAQKAKLTAYMNLAADTIMQLYANEYAFMTLQPLRRTYSTGTSPYTQYEMVRATAKVPAIPYTIDAACKAITGKDAWTWAKQKVYDYLDAHAGTGGTDKTLTSYVKANLDNITPGTTYYLTAESNNTFGYLASDKLKSTDKTVNWILYNVSTQKDNLVDGVYNIKNVGTQKYVEVYGKYEAEPRLDKFPSPMTIQDIVNTSIKLELGRTDRNNDKLYQISELSARGANVVTYITKAFTLAKKLADDKLEGKQSTVQSIIDKINTKIGTTTLTYDNVITDVHTAIDMLGEEYAQLKLQDNGDGTVSLYTDVPAIPEYVDKAYKMAGGTAENAWAWAKYQINAYLESHNTDAALVKLINQNLNKITPGNRYYLSAENGGTFEMVEVAPGQSYQLTNNERWTLEDASKNSASEYVRIENALGKKYIEVRGRATAQPDITNDNKYTKAGTVIKMTVQPYSEGLTVKELRSQNISPVKYVNVGLDFIANNICTKIDGYISGSKKEILDQYDANLYLEPVLTTDNTLSYYAGATNPDLEVVTNYLRAHSDKSTYLIAAVWSKLGTKLTAYGITQTEFTNAFTDGDALWALIQKITKKYAANHTDNTGIQYAANYINAGHTGFKYYLMEGRMTNPVWTADQKNTYEQSDKLGFCNNSLNNWEGSDLQTVGDGAKWLLETIDDTNYFGVTCLTSPDVKDAEGNWYTTAYFDFPFKVNDGTAYYISKTTADKTKNIYTATATEITGTVPAQTPVLLKVKGSDAASNKLTPVYQETEDAATSNNLLKGGVYADAGKTGTINDLYDGGTLLGLPVENMFAANTAWFFGTTIPTDKVGKGYYHTLDVSNKNGKVGFYFYTGTTLAGNKAALYFDTPIFNSVAEADGTTGNAKSFVLQFGDETTGITDINSEETNKGNNKIYDLQGRQVTTPSHGIYIINGKKVLFK